MLLNQWYVAAEAADVTEKPLAAHLLGQDFVVFRDRRGKVRCLSDICIHRGGSLCRGKVVEGTIQCPYHGWRFNGDGNCVEIPSLGPDANIPRRARVDSYPVKEKYGWVWVFLGDAREEDRPPLPDFFPEYEEYERTGTSEWRFIRGSFTFDCNWVRALENGVDHGHASFVHTDFGNKQNPFVPDYEVEHRGHALYSGGAGKAHKKRGLWKEEMPEKRPDVFTDVQIWVPAPCIRIHMRMLPPKGMMIVTAYIPLNEKQTLLRFIHGRNFLTDPKHDADTYKRMFTVFQEDADVINYLKPDLVPPLLSDELAVKMDAHNIAFRKKYKEAEARGLAVDLKAMESDDDIVRVIPSPARADDPNNWVFRPVLRKKVKAAAAAAE